MYFLLLVSVLAFSPVVVCLDIIGPTNRANWGTWGLMHYCAEGTYAAGYDMKIQPKQGVDHDDVSLIAIKLVCLSLDGRRFGGNITSTFGHYFGYWSGVIMCPNNMFLKEFALQVEENQHSGDDTAANYIKFRCGRMDSGSCNYELAQTPGYGFWGVIGGWSRECSTNSAICGIQTRVEDYHYGGDNTCLNDVKFTCCNDDSLKK
ncbi:vitelline membrane outer layer protein 1-like [Ruditapes philippinarum]|uniref:vitelline membrane outer layer protein 1-like n=1 Tax=Ruditapes philippinarum TaxID=129788 RepID=UPI00295AC74D|nr:vitelline membrane outer layer protein 1-like [Ruditapes philippinarum]